ncbi:MAG: hypothetical protein JNL26_19560, partial [Gemmatimonadetes bacterium]|nr:hypothetical protein [Gemmatimonadota bacterium]
MSFPAATRLALVAFLATPLLAGAQRVLGPGTDATVLPRGMLRVTTGP